MAIEPQLSATDGKGGKSTGKSRSSPSDTRTSSNRKKLAFWGIAGALGIFALKVPFERGELIFAPDLDTSVWATPSNAAAWTAIVLLLYAWSVRKLTQTQFEAETTGDNCYYLGFLFTLISLALTLYLLQDTASSDIRGVNNAELLQNIVSGFGIALTSTIVGIALRVWFFQHRGDQLDTEKASQIEDVDGIKAFHAALSESATQLKNFATETIELTAERDKHIREATDKAVEMQLDAAKKIISEVDSLIQTQQRHLEETTKSLTQLVETLTIQSSNRISEEFKTKLIEPAAASFAELQTTVRKLTERLEELEDSQISKIERSGKDMLEMWETLNEASIEHVRITAKASKKLDELSGKTIKEQKQASEQLTRTVRDELETVRKAMEALANGKPIESRWKRLSKRVKDHLKTSQFSKRIKNYIKTGRFKD